MDRARTPKSIPGGPSAPKWRSSSQVTPLTNAEYMKDMSERCTAGLSFLLLQRATAHEASWGLPNMLGIEQSTLPDQPSHVQLRMYMCALPYCIAVYPLAGVLLAERLP